MIRRSAIACGAAMALAFPLSSGVASADDGAERETWGTCTPMGRWELSSETTRTGGLKVEFEIEGVPVDSQWSYTLTGPSGQLADGLATADSDGEVEIEVLTTGSIDDVVTALATSEDRTCDSTLDARADDDSDDDARDDDSDDDSDDDRYDDHSREDDDHRSDDDQRARSGSGTVLTGYCDGSSSLIVTTSRRGRTTLTINSDRRGQKWNYALNQGRKTVKKGVGTTRRDGSLTVKTRKSVKAPRATAARLGGGERCATSRVS